MRARQVRSLGWCLARLLLLLSCVAGGSAGRAMAAGPVEGSSPGASPGPAGTIVPEHGLVFVRVPADDPVTSGSGRAGGMLRADYGDGGQIWRLASDGSVRKLAPGFAATCDPDVSFDGRRILFAGRRRPDDSWNIYEMQADGAGVRQITHDAGNCRSPGYLSTFYTIVSTEPWFQLMFVSDMAGEKNEYGQDGATSLYSCRIDGTSVRRLTINPSDDFDPFLMRDGRILVSCWRRMNLVHGYQGRIELFGINSDGTDYALFSRNDTARIRRMACEVGDTWADRGLVVFIESDAAGWDGGGRLAGVAERTPFAPARRLGTARGVVYHSPAPLTDGTLVVARRPADGSRPYALWRLDPVTGEETLILDDPAYHDFHARSLSPRPKPDGRSSSVNEEIKTGILYCLDTGLVAPEDRRFVRPGMAKSLRVIEGVPVSDGQDRSLPGGFRHGFVGGGSSRDNVSGLLRRRLLGVVPVEQDGSFQIEVPPNVPIELQTLDEDGIALFDCGWIWVKNRDWRGCVGCHEDPLRVPENLYVDAVRKPAVKLLAPPEERRTVDFLRDVMPIVESRCTGCHDGRKDSLDLTSRSEGPFNRAYLGLLAISSETPGENQARRGKWVHPGEARTSPLVWMLLGRNTARPWDPEYDPKARVERHPSAGAAAPLSVDEIKTCIEWIDLGAPWDGIPGDDPASADPAGAARDGKDSSTEHAGEGDVR